MTRLQALNAILSAGIQARLERSDEPAATDDIFALSDKAYVQITGRGFVAAVEEGEGDDWGVIHGRLTRDPVAAAREALMIANA